MTLIAMEFFGARVARGCGAESRNGVKVGPMPFETQRLRIRHFVLEDAAAIYKLSQESGMKRFIPDQVYDDEAEAASVLGFLIAQYGKPDLARSGTYVQAVELKSTGRLIGHVGLSPADGEMELGYAIAEAYQRNGYATELVRETVRWALEDHALPCVLGIVSCDNHPSIRVLEQGGFTLLHERKRSLHGRATLVRTYIAEP